MCEADARGYPEELADAHDYAIEILRTPFWGDFEVIETGKRNAVAGSLDVVESGYPGKAMSWILIVRSWIPNAVQNDPPSEEEKQLYAKRYQDLLRSLNFGSQGDLAEKTAKAEQLIPKVMKVAERIAAKAAK